MRKKNKIKRRRLTKEEYESNPLWYKEHTNVRLSQECINMIDYMTNSYPEMYYNKAHLIECAIRRLYKTHKNQQITTFYVT